MDVHTVSGNVVDGFRHEGDEDPVFACDRCRDPFRERNLVACLCKADEVELDLKLRCRDLVVMIFYRDPDRAHSSNNIVPHVEILVRRVESVVALLDPETRVVVVRRAYPLLTLDFVVAVRKLA